MDGRESVLTKGTEDNEGKSVAQEELKDPSKAHEEATDEIIRCNGGDPIAACPSPSHELTGQRTQAEQEAEESEGSRIAECLTKVSFDIVLGVQVDLLEQLGADRN